MYHHLFIVNRSGSLSYNKVSLFSLLFLLRVFLLLLFPSQPSPSVPVHPSKNLSKDAPTFTSNEWLRIGGTFHGLYAISQQVLALDIFSFFFCPSCTLRFAAWQASPVRSSGLQTFETDTLKLECFQTLTGFKFILTGDKRVTDLSRVLAQLYEAFADFVMKVSSVALNTSPRYLSILLRTPFMRWTCRSGAQSSPKPSTSSSTKPTARRSDKREKETHHVG